MLTQQVEELKEQLTKEKHRLNCGTEHCVYLLAIHLHLFDFVGLFSKCVSVWLAADCVCMFFANLVYLLLLCMYRSAKLVEKVKVLKKKEAEETAALENMVQMVEKNLQLTTVWHYRQDS